MIRLQAKPGPNCQDMVWSLFITPRMKTAKFAAEVWKQSRPTLHRGVQGTQNIHNVVCLKSEKFWNTFGPQGLEKGWERVMSTDLRNPSAVKCPWQSKQPENNLWEKPNEEWQQLNEIRSIHLNNWWGEAACSTARRRQGNAITLRSDINLSPLQANFITQFSLSPRTATSGPWLHLYPQAHHPLTLRFEKQKYFGAVAIEKQGLEKWFKRNLTVNLNVYDIIYIHF